MPMTILKIPTAVLWVAVKLVDCFISVIIGFVAFVTVAYFLYRMNFGLPGVAVAFIIGQVIYLLAAWILTLRLVSREYRAMTQLEAEILINKSDTWW
jgi:TRAP-type C4-dicarboxylate transport system permease small subunit